MASEMRRVFINCHVPKTAGTSLIDGFYQLFGQDNCLIQADIRDAAFPTSILQHAGEKSFFSGHVTLPKLIAVKQELAKRDIDAQIVSSIREPVSHFLSVFLHSQRFGGLDGRQGSVSLEEYLKAPGDFPGLDFMVSNSVTKYYSGDLADFRSGASSAVAAENVKAVDFLFIAEKLDQSFDMFCERYGLLRRPNIERLNENNRNSSKYLLQNYRLLPAIAATNQFDCEMYSILAQRWADDAAAKEFSQIKVKSADAGMSLAEGMRRADYAISAQTEELVQFVANDMLLHPPGNGMSEISAPAVFDANGYLRITTGVTLDARSLSKVMVSLEVFCGDKYACHTVMVEPGENSSMTFDMTAVFGRCDVRMSSYLSAGSERPDFAILKLINPRFILQP
jgi:hypothetical protein